MNLFNHEGAVNTSAAVDCYLAQHPEIQQQIEAQAKAGAASEQYSGSALQLLEEEMAREYGDGQPFIDPGSQAYEAFDYQKPQDNGSSEDKTGLELGQYPQYPGPLPEQSCRRHSFGSGGAGGRQDGTRGGEKGEAEANSGMISCLAKPSFPDAIVTVALLAANNKRHQDLCQVKHFLTS